MDTFFQEKNFSSKPLYQIAKPLWRLINIKILAVTPRWPQYIIGEMSQKKSLAFWPKIFSIFGKNSSLYLNLKALIKSQMKQKIKSVNAMKKSKGASLDLRIFPSFKILIIVIKFTKDPTNHRIKAAAKVTVKIFPDNFSSILTYVSKPTSNFIIKWLGHPHQNWLWRFQISFQLRNIF